MPAIIPFIFIGFILFIVVGGILGGVSRHKRLQAIRAWSASLGFTFDPRKRRGFDREFPEFACFRHGKNRYAHNLSHGVFEGRTVWAFDYHYETESTRTVHTRDSKGRITGTRTKKVTHHHHFSALILVPNLRLKPMLLRPEGFGDRIANFFGKNDLDFESAAFSKRYHVSANDRRWPYDVLHARTIEFLLEQPTYTLEFEPTRVLAMRGKRRMSAEEFHSALTIIDGVLDRLPDYVRDQLADEHAPATNPSELPA